MANIFNSVVASKPRRSAFNLSHEVKTSGRFGSLIPVLCQEVLPSDKWKFSTESFTRFAPTQAPIMQRINTFEHYYFVPNRILWKGWERFISPSEHDDERPVMPSLLFDDVPSDLSGDEQSELLSLFQVSGLADYLGMNFILSNDVNDLWTSGMKINLLPIMAYNLVWFEYYADENQLDVRRMRDMMSDLADLGEIKVSGLTSDVLDEIVFLFKVKQRAWEKDYFTASLPNTQRGDEITLGAQEANMPAMYVPNNIGVSVNRAAQLDGSAVGQTGAIGSNALLDDQIANVNDNFNPPSVVPVKLVGSTTEEPQVVDNEGNPISQTSIEVNPVTINELRRAIKLQEFLEKSMRGGYRLIEQIKAHFGVTSSDARLQRPQFLGGDMQKVIVSEVSSTADTIESTNGKALGTYSGHLTEIGNTKRRSFYSEEHGWIICLFSCLPRTSYMQGMPKQYQRFDWLDFAWPEFSHLGEQEVKVGELYNTVNQGYREKVFGYQSRYAEYKYIPSQIHGAFRNKYQFWTMARRFSSLPALSRQFIECQYDDTSITDAFTIADASSDYLFINLYHKITCVRPLPRFGVPML